MRTFLDVPFPEKDKAKALGAKWDPKSTKWYIPPGVAKEPFARWLPKEPLQKIDLQMALAVARDPNSTSETMALLAEDHDELRHEVLLAIVGNPNTPPHALVNICEHRNLSADLAVQLLANPLLPSEGRAHLAFSGFVKVDLEDPATSPIILDRMADPYSSVETRAKVGGNPSTPPETLAWLVRDLKASFRVRAAVGGNPSTPEETLAVLAEDRDWRVREAVRKNPKAHSSLKESIPHQLPGDPNELLSKSTQAIDSAFAKAHETALEHQKRILAFLKNSDSSIRAATMYRRPIPGMDDYEIRIQFLQTMEDDEQDGWIDAYEWEWPEWMSHEEVVGLRNLLAELHGRGHLSIGPGYTQSELTVE
jgi:hypothetical protein